MQSLFGVNSRYSRERARALHLQIKLYLTKRHTHTHTHHEILSKISRAIFASKYLSNYLSYDKVNYCRDTIVRAIDP